MLVLVVGRQADRPVLGGMTWGTALTALVLGVFALVALKYSLNTDNTTVGVHLALTAAVVQRYGAYVTKVEEPPASAAAGPEPTAPAAPAVLPPVAPSWPETAYLLTTWLRAGSSVDTVVSAYRRAFASDPSRLVRLTSEVHALLDPGRDPAEREALLAAHARQWTGVGATLPSRRSSQGL